MNTRTTAAALLAAAALTLTACSSSSDSNTKSAPSPKTSASKLQGEPADLTAKQAAAELADATGVTTLGSLTDNTSACSQKAAGKEPNANDCTQLITTDTVSIYEFKTPSVAAHWVEGMKTTGDWRQVSRFALAWTARDQKLTDDDRRVQLVKALEKATANES
ncbi:hypothetical protein ACF073_29000 [Streptomyces sp. NPDC015171]|uniref:hypothetical protein n=1 Tax=Streptomyces sp. NPDC015171 TaxID=3364945 RepID=UPI0036FB92DA